MGHREQLLSLVRELAIVRGKVTLSSGREADYSVDLRRITLSGAAAPLVGEVMLELTKDWDYDAVGGLTMGADPIATGMLHAACGEVETRRSESEITRQNRLRILHAEEFNATQRDVVHRLEGWAASGKRIDFVHIETKTAFAGLCEMIEDQLGFEPVRHDPLSRGKELRLRDVSGAIDEATCVTGGTTAIVEFPGVWGEEEVAGVVIRKLVCHPEYVWAVRQLLDFGMMKADHFPDAATQLIMWLLKRGDLSMGDSGMASEAIKAALGERGDQRMRKMMDKWLKPKPTTNATSEEVEWLRSNRADRNEFSMNFN